MVSKKRKSLALMFGMALATMSVSALMPGCSSKESTNVAEENLMPSMKTFEETLDYLKVDEKERKRIDSLATTDVYINYSESFADYQEAMKTISWEEFKQTDEGKAYSKAVIDLQRVTYNMGLSVNASTAINMKPSFDNPIKKK